MECLWVHRLPNHVFTWKDKHGIRAFFMMALILLIGARLLTNHLPGDLSPMPSSWGLDFQHEFGGCKHLAGNS